MAALLSPQSGIDWREWRKVTAGPVQADSCGYNSYSPQHHHDAVARMRRCVGPRFFLYSMRCMYWHLCQHARPCWPATTYSC
eukprot:354266-Chlamydomonas_euryale.AAC.9